MRGMYLLLEHCFGDPIIHSWLVDTRILLGTLSVAPKRAPRRGGADQPKNLSMGSNHLQHTREQTRGTVGRDEDASTKSDRKQEHSTCKASVEASM